MRARPLAVALRLTGLRLAGPLALTLCLAASAAAQSSAAPVPPSSVPDAGTTTGASDLPDAGAAASSNNGDASLLPSAPQQPLPTVLPAEAKSQPPDSEESAPPAAPRPRPRFKLRSTLGGRDEDIDLGAEADALRPVGGTDADDAAGAEFRLARWTFNIRGIVRMPVRLGWGPRGDGQPGTEMHQPRLVGNSTTEWNFVNLPRGANNGFVLVASSGNVGVTLSMVASNSTTTGGWEDLTAIPSFSTGSLFVRYPEAFGSLGGLTLRAGVLALRYGLAGPGYIGSGYYGTFQFGRIQAPGAVVSSDLYLSDRWGLILEGGGNAAAADINQNVFYTKSLPLPTTVLGTSSYVVHAHASLEQGRTFRLGAHFVQNWAPNDGAPFTQRDSATPRLRVYGGDVHVSDRRWGDGYIGFTRVEGRNLDKPLGEVLEVIHHRGSDLIEFFNSPNFTVPNPTGTIHSLQFQHTFALSTLAGPGSYLKKHKLAVSLFGMYTRGTSPVPPGAELYPGMPFHAGSLQMLKFGSELQFAPVPWMDVLLQFDHVRPDLSANSAALTDFSLSRFAGWILPSQTNPTNESAFSVVQPKLILRRGRGSNAFIVIGYAHFFLAPFVTPISPQNRTNRRADTDQLAVVAYMRI